MTYQNIPGWFNFEGFYDRIVREAPSPARFVEVGCWLGKSTAYLAEAIVGSHKEIELFVYDIFTGSPNEPDMVAAAAAMSVEAQFLQNLRACGINLWHVACQPGAFGRVLKSQAPPKVLRDFYEAVRRKLHECHPLPMDFTSNFEAGHDFMPGRYDRLESVQASTRHEDASLDFVFIDACHTYEAVVADIAAWRLKVKPGGILAGHDIHTYGDVARAVNDAFPGKYQIQDGCWWIRL
jgi:SAM-dependent methyltransferase